MNAHDWHGALFAALTLKPLGADGSPVRAFAMEDVCLPS